MPSDRTTSRKLSVTTLEDRTNPTPLTALTSGSQLLTFDSASPGTVTTTPITGLTNSDTLVAIDYRPSNGQLFGLGTRALPSVVAPAPLNGQLYLINPTSGTATPVGSGFVISTAGGGSGIGFDFNPAVDRIRLVTENGTNLRLNPDTGAIAGTDSKLAYESTSFDLLVGGTPPTPQVAAASYTLNPRGTGTVTTLYGLDSNLDLLFTQGGPEQDPSANAGQLFPVSKVGFDVIPGSAFDIESGTDKAFATGAGNKLYSVNLTTGATASLGTLGQTITGLAVAPPTTGPGTFSLPATIAFNADRGPIQVPVTRTGGSSLPATVDFSTASGTAVSGADFAPASGTLNFAPGETTKLITLVLPGGTTAAGAAKSFVLNLTNATGGAAIDTAAVQVTIPAVDGTVAQSGRIVAVGSGTGSRVTVYDALTGAVRYSFDAFEPSVTSGVSVATADTNGDGFDDIIVGAGNGGGPRVVIFDGSVQDRTTANRGTILADFFAYEDTFRGGVIVAAGDVNGDGFEDVVAGTGVGGGPRVRVFSGVDLAPGASTPNPIKDFFAYEDTFRGGVNVAASDINGDGFADLIAGAGNGGGPRVRTFDSKTNALTADFFAYEDTFRGGVFVAAGNVTPDGRVNIVTGTGPGGGPVVRVFDAQTPQNRDTAPAFNAFDGNVRTGVRVATNDFGPDGFDELVAATGPGSPAAVRAFNAAGTQVATLPFDDAFTGGLFVG